MPDLTPGVPSALSPLVRRIVAPNPGPFTGPGTNTYLVGIDEVAVIDPGPRRRRPHRRDRRRVDARARPLGAAHPHASRPLAGHQAAGRADRRGGAGLLQAQPRQGRRRRRARPRPSARATPSRAPSSGSRCCTRPATRPNHLCFLLEEERVLFTGDTVLDGMCSVVNPGARRRHGRLPGDARAAEEAAALADLPGPRRRDRGAEGPARRVPRRTASSGSSRCSGS